MRLKGANPLSLFIDYEICLKFQIYWKSIDWGVLKVSQLNNI